MEVWRGVGGVQTLYEMTEYWRESGGRGTRDGATSTRLERDCSCLTLYGAGDWRGDNVLKRNIWMCFVMCRCFKESLSVSWEAVTENYQTV